MSARVTDDGKGNLTVTCATPGCGKPLTVANAHGMFCADRHGEAESAAAAESIKELLAAFVPRGAQ